MAVVEGERILGSGLEVTSERSVRSDTIVVTSGRWLCSNEAEGKPYPY
jgi:hypothetical protein